MLTAVRASCGKRLDTADAHSRVGVSGGARKNKFRATTLGRVGGWHGFFRQLICTPLPGVLHAWHLDRALGGVFRARPAHRKPPTGDGRGFFSSQG
jgi:hypothetical protein